MSVISDILLKDGISAEKVKKFELFAAMLKETNAKFNLTRITDDESMAKLHFIDSLSPCRLGLIPSGAKLIDIGTGGGFPSIPLAIFDETLSITAVEASEKKLGFVEGVSKELGLKINCVCARAEELGTSELRESFDVAVSRAVASMSMILELSAPFVKVGGKILCYKGQNCSEELELSRNAPKKLSLSEPRLHDAHIDEMNHVIAEYTKTAKLTQAYPRRFAKIKAEPL